MNILKVQQAFTVNQEQNLDAPNSESQKAGVIKNEQKMCENFEAQIKFYKTS